MINELHHNRKKCREMEKISGPQPGSLHQHLCFNRILRWLENPPSLRNTICGTASHTQRQVWNHRGSFQNCALAYKLCFVLSAQCTCKFLEHLARTDTSPGLSLHPSHLVALQNFIAGYERDDLDLVASLELLCCWPAKRPWTNWWTPQFTGMMTVYTS